MPRLTEQEQQEIIRFIEADKPLPERYRFLLFEDKREVELVWNGKTAEVCNIVLPFQVIEQVDEPRAEKPEETSRIVAERGQIVKVSKDKNGIVTHPRPLSRRARGDLKRCGRGITFSRTSGRVSARRKSGRWN